jgi:glycosyltransferase involved in cell wall biosynthesis
MRLAIIADWLTVFGGAEHAIAEFASLFPDAPIFTTVARRSRLGPLAHARIRTTNLQPWYRLVRNHQILLPWMPQAIESIDLRGFDVILSSSHAVGKGIVPPSDAVHICYCHTPMRYAWEMEEQYLEDFNVPRLLRRPIRRQLANIRRWDLTTAKRVDRFIANSLHTQERIARTYGRESAVIPPPVHDRFFATALRPMNDRQTFLAVGRLVPYKRFDLLIELANQLQLPLTIVGTGQEEERLRRMAGETVRILGFVRDEDLPSLYSDAKALLFPQEEDAGIVPLEAQASGTPVVAFGRGGVLDSVKEGHTGLFFREQTIEGLRDAVERARTHAWDPDAIRTHARSFSQENFRKRIREEVENAYRVLQEKKKAVIV